MKVNFLKIPEVILLEPEIFTDERGFFFESFNTTSFKKATGLSPKFVQDNHSQSIKGVLRGLHYQVAPCVQGKLVRVIRGEVYDVVLDIRKHSPTFGQWVGQTLSAENKNILWVPGGFAHGFLTISDTAEFLYKTTDFYFPSSERCIIWNDPDINIDWPFTDKLSISPKDSQGLKLKDSELL